MGTPAGVWISSERDSFASVWRSRQIEGHLLWCMDGPTQTQEHHNRCMDEQTDTSTPLQLYG